MNLQELNERRCAAKRRVLDLGVTNTPTDPEERLRADAKYKLVCDAWFRAEKEYRDALEKTPTGELMNIANSGL